MEGIAHTRDSSSQMLECVAFAVTLSTGLQEGPLLVQKYSSDLGRGLQGLL